MEVRVLGSAAGGGFPQWNCSCENCARVRRGDGDLQARDQSSIAVSPDGQTWILINASPDIRHQLNAFPGFRPGPGPRETALAGVVLVDSQIDHSAGLLILRESSRPIDLYTTDRVYTDLTGGFPVISMLRHYCGVNWHRIPLNGKKFAVDSAPELDFTAVPLESKAPPYSPAREAPGTGDNTGLLIEDRLTGKRLFYAPGLGRFEPHLERPMASADCLLIDGTAWTDDEMERAGVGHKRVSEMGHVPQSGPGGMIETLSRFDGRKILIHINNTNPILDGDSEERAILSRKGIEVARDGMQFTV